MTIAKDKVVSIEYTLKDSEGEILDSSEGMGPLDYIHGHQNLIPGLERELDGKKAGDELSVTVEAADGYGEYNQELVVEVPKSQFEDGVTIEEGMQFEASSPDGNRVVTVIEVTDEKVTIDANHPLAGEKLFFTVKITGVRDATEEELAHGLHEECGCGCGGDCDDGCDDDCCGGHDHCGCGCH
ncbi:FKBP-type peptidyl-prolyl cis-trans isomerase [Treponema brennaborense]|uniref:Peptidyl-prolyl cis-trans isomerase n=1 Tax=Treponema brennaborense (strain DSM 12168 / CIP 105900 / DD5/3) TaxID=906968 RepID=F4LLY8_TREBD|nr:peptidylprolyl isomerase [Treponema brennaborense]AEE15680.1 Peptidylprolyl isomerase [Treponema brennaborense DSM 12168]